MTTVETQREIRSDQMVPWINDLSSILHEPKQAIGEHPGDQSVIYCLPQANIMQGLDSFSGIILTVSRTFLPEHLFFSAHIRFLNNGKQGQDQRYYSDIVTIALNRSEDSVDFYSEHSMPISEEDVWLPDLRVFPTGEVMFPTDVPPTNSVVQ